MRGDDPFKCFFEMDASPKTVALIVFTVILTVMMETFIRIGGSGPDPATNAPTAGNADTLVERQPIEESPVPQPKPKPQAWDPKKEAMDQWLMREIFPLNETAAPPRLRTHRFLVATVLLSAILTLASIRLSDGVACGGSWWLMSIFSILPILTAFCAWLRTLVDCILWRWESSVAEKYWPPALPIFALVFLLTICGVAIYHECDKPRKRSGQDIELGADEEGGQDEEDALIGNMEGGGSQDWYDDAPPEYSAGGSSGSGSESRAAEESPGNKKTVVYMNCR